ncbi:MAG: 3-phosphoserine/phosphohydroxythreonine transaminase [Oscillospiraceae bacterium]|nr:3-phosphoserine/phosphohydroxythreonine transaminase [Oscillospiraceae bacterium]
MKRVYNFSAGPAVLPEEVLQQAANEMLCYQDTGQSVMEMSHRSAEYEAIIRSAEDILREIMGVPANYKVLFLQGGASLQFSMVPLNLMGGKTADYVVTGEFANKAAKEATKFGHVNRVASSEDQNFSYIPSFEVDKDAAYLHITTNNTIYGTRWTDIPDVSVPLVADMSSDILSRVYDVEKFGLIYAGAQKNLGAAGVTVVIIREDLIGHAPPDIPAMLDYAVHAKAGSLYNTPSTYAVYIVKLVCEWIRAQGGVTAIQTRNEAKAKLLYDYLDQSSMFNGTATPKDRSIMNVTFVTQSKELDAKFTSEAAKHGFINLKGHRAVGGMRASIYNAMPYSGVEELVQFMRRFEDENQNAK